MSIPEGATHINVDGFYYKKNESGEWLYYGVKNKWLKSRMSSKWCDSHTKELTTSRDEALEFLVKHLSSWPNNSFNTVLPHGWSWDSYLGDTRLCHTLHDSIIREDWRNAKQVKMLSDSGFTGEAWYIGQRYNIDRPLDSEPSLESFEQSETGREMVERFNRDVLGSVRPIHSDVIRFSEWMIGELNCDKC